MRYKGVWAEQQDRQLQITSSVFRAPGAVAAMVAVVLLAQDLDAATFIVANNLDAGPHTFRQAILDANEAPGVHTISFSSVTGVITLSSDLPQVLQSVDIVGPGTNRLTVSGNNQFRIFSFAAGTSNRLSGLTIAHGFLTNYANGAGILNAGALVLEDSLIVSNRTLTGWGGGVFNSGQLVLENCVLAKNAVVGESGSAALCGGGGGGGAGLGGAVFTTRGSLLVLCNMLHFAS
jgi:hypothetical protein